MTAVAQHQGSSLVIHNDQSYWNDNQLAALHQLGVERASKADLGVFFHQCTRTGLDPFARQIYMIERQGKQTIQTGIDGFRLIGRRAVDRTRETLEVSEAEWCGPDGVWRDVWLASEPPAAARVTVFRNGGRFPAIALYSEYVALKRDGSPNAMWKSRPAGQLAKCAEALAWRKAFPQDLSGLYTSDEMAQADNPQQPQQAQRRHLQEPERPAPSGRDWLAELQDCETPEQVKDLGKQIPPHEATPDVRQQINEAWAALKAGETSTEGVSAEADAAVEAVEGVLVDDDGVVQE